MSKKVRWLAIFYDKLKDTTYYAVFTKIPTGRQLNTCFGRVWDFGPVKTSPPGLGVVAFGRPIFFKNSKEIVPKHPGYLRMQLVDYHVN